jgi:hypothetical protein
MRKLFLISVFVLASAAAQAGQARGLALAANDERIESVQPDQPTADVLPEAAKSVAAKPVTTEAAKPVTEAPKPAKEVAKPVRTASWPANKVHARGYENEEAQARSIAARYGVSW